MVDRTLSLTDLLRDSRWLYGFAGLVCAVAAGCVLGGYGVLGAVFVVGVPVALLLVVAVLLDPRVGLLLYVNAGFLIGITRYITIPVPLGVVLDTVLVLTLVSVFLNGKNMDWYRLKHPVMLLLTLWFVYTLLEYLNPNAPSQAAWFYHIRSFSLNWYLLAIITLVVPITRRDLRTYIIVWLCWSVAAALWGFKQQYIGLTQSELDWLAMGFDRQHILWGKLRSFSFYTDAGQFGSEMAGTTLLCLIWGLESKRLPRRVGYLLLAAVLFWGFAVSGTRSALFALLAGYPAYLFLMRKVGPVVRGALMATPIMLILLFTHIGDSVYQIWRLRTALRPSEDASFLVRLENQAKLQNYMKDLPFGAGIGSSSGAGQRFSPNHFAAQTPTDSWYVQIWIETGVVGLSLYLFVIIGISIIGIRRVWQIQDRRLRILLIALLAEFMGIALVSYSNPIMGQFPTSTLLFINCILFTTGKRWDMPEPVADISARQPVASASLYATSKHPFVP